MDLYGRYLTYWFMEIMKQQTFHYGERPTHPLAPEKTSCFMAALISSLVPCSDGWLRSFAVCEGIFKKTKSKIRTMWIKNHNFHWQHHLPFVSLNIGVFEHEVYLPRGQFWAGTWWSINGFWSTLFSHKPFWISHESLMVNINSTAYIYA